MLDFMAIKHKVGKEILGDTGVEEDEFGLLVIQLHSISCGILADLVELIINSGLFWFE